MAFSCFSFAFMFGYDIVGYGYVSIMNMLNSFQVFACISRVLGRFIPTFMSEYVLDCRTRMLQVEGRVGATLFNSLFFLILLLNRE